MRSFIKKLLISTANIEDSKQLIKSTGSVGANYIEANEALSKKDFYHRIKICRKESKENRYWLRFLFISQEHSELENGRNELIQEATELMKIFGAIITRKDRKKRKLIKQIRIFNTFENLYFEHCLVFSAKGACPPMAGISLWLKILEFRISFMEIIESIDKISWENFNRTQKLGSLLQSWDWADFQAGRQQKIWRFEVKDNEKTVAQMFLWKHRFLIGQNGLYCARGPVIADEFLDDFEKLKEIFKILLKKTNKIAEQNKSLLFQLDPNVLIDIGRIENEIWKNNFFIDKQAGWIKMFKELNFIKSDKEVQPAHTIILNLSKTEDELLAQMHQKTRYNIRLAKKRGVKVFESFDVEAFFKLIKQTTARQGFGVYPIKYFQDILKLKHTKLYLAEYQGKIIAGILCTYYKNVCTYLFGASADEYRNVMAPHLLQWTAIKQAKKAGFEFYDFWGASPKDSKVKQEKSWQGITRFKQGFNPDQPIFEHMGCYEMIYRPMVLKIWDNIYKIYRLLRR